MPSSLHHKEPRQSPFATPEWLAARRAAKPWLFRCRVDGCGTDVDVPGAYCPLHRAQAQERRKQKHNRTKPKGSGYERWRRYVQGDDCAYCGHRTVTMTMDHMQPLARGGSRAWDNLARCCSRCNKEKADKDLFTFLSVVWSRPMNNPIEKRLRVGRHRLHAKQVRLAAGQEWAPMAPVGSRQLAAVVTQAEGKAP